MSSVRWIRGGVLFAALVALAGCGSSSPTGNQKPVHPVRGEVYFGTKPAAGAFVVFVPVSEPPDAPDPRPRGHVNEDGSFRLSTYGVDDGAPAGEYIVTIPWSVGDRDDEDKLGGRDVDRTKSKLKATVQEGNNDIPAFKLK